jgi:peptide deformylase
MTLKIETWKDNPILRTVCEKIKQSEWKQYAKLWKEMVAYIKNPDHAGVWLAAPQIWITKRIMVVSLLQDWEDETFSTVMMINPELLEVSPEMTKEIEEWCLSLPKAKKWFVARHESIKLSYYDEKMKQKVIRLSGLASVIVQHEIDHLNGELYIDKLVK